jgi:DNA sulfur modification protein DndD
VILDELVVHNFGVYRDRQALDLRPPSRQRPIILFGGLNGGGKTTILDALQLVLYGKLAQCSNRGDLAYDEFLRRCIHRGVQASEGAALELEFRHRSEAHEQTFRIHRSWAVRDGRVREKFEVRRNGEDDPVLTEAWAEQVEDFIPIGLSQFFFFDGEKIEALADLSRSTEVLSAAVHSLLGLDLVDQLATDLLVLERRKRTDQRSDAERDVIAVAERELELLNVRRGDLTARRGAAQNAFAAAEKRLLQAEGRFKLAGGDAFERRRETEVKRDAVAEQLRAAEEEARELAAGAAPLLVVAEQLEVLAASAETSRAADESVRLGKVLAARDDKALAALREVAAPYEAIVALSEFFARDRERRSRVRKVDRGPALGADALDAVLQARGVLRSGLTDQLDRHTRQIARLQIALQRLDRQLASAPDADAIGVLARSVSTAREECAARRREVELLDEQLAEASREHEFRLASLTRLLEKSVEKRYRQDEAARVVQHSERARSVLGRFRGAVATRHVNRIERLVLDGFRHLLRKESLVAALRIEPVTFALTLLDEAGGTVHPERLSAGERQLLAISIIWAITRASGRVLPIAVDTPLGRLDSTHRGHLVERYFPFASHQVLLFSTDEEIDAQQYERLRPSVGRSFRLNFDDKSGLTRVEPGYLW